MEAHPIPQNVTSFEFHLVGDMTLKQFGYLGGGVAIAYILFIMLANSAPLIGYPLVFFFALAGISFAFVPINNRPLDHWVKAYFRAIFGPTQREWRKNNLSAKDPIFPNRLAAYITQVGIKSYSDQNKASLLPAPNLGIIAQRAPVTQTLVQAPAPTLQPFKEIVPEPKREEVPTSEQLEDTVKLAKEAQEIQKKIVDTEHILTQLRAKAPGSGEDKQYSEELKTVVSELQELTTEASGSSVGVSKVTHYNAPPVTPKVVAAPKKVLPANLSLTSFPNVINGVVTDSQNNYLEGAIVVTHDKDGLPVRALKSNKLGQFVAATPLPNGTYTLTLEKENLVFDKVQVTLDGKVMPPVMVAAKKGGAA